MCNETDRELIRIDFQIMDLKKEQENLVVDSQDYKEIQLKIDGLERLKEIKRAEQKTS